MYPFSPAVLQMLHDAGWTEDRRIDIGDFEDKLRHLSIELFPCVREFLTRFGNLDFTRTRRFKTKPGWAPFGIQLVPATWTETTVDWLNTTIIDPEPDWFEYQEQAIGRTLQRVGSLDIAPSRCDVCADRDGRLYLSGDGQLDLLGVSIYDGLEAVLTDRPYIETWLGDKKDWRKLGKAAKWRDFVSQTRIIPPDEVIALLVPEAVQAIQETAQLYRRACLDDVRVSVRAAMLPLRGTRPDSSQEEWLRAVREVFTAMRRDISASDNQSVPTDVALLKSLRSGVFVCAIALFAYGDFDAAIDIVNHVDATPTPAMRRLVHVVPLLLPPLRNMDPLTSSLRVRDWLEQQRGNWVWNEEYAQYVRPTGFQA